MEPIERRTPDLSVEEWALVLQLLEREDALLPVEISHTPPAACGRNCARG